MELQVQSTTNIPDGMHDGVITQLVHKENIYEGKKVRYTDIHIESKEFKIRYGCPTYVSPTSKLGRVLSNFTKLEPNTKIDVDQALVGKVITFMTLKKKSVKDGKEYAEVVEGSIKPKVEGGV